MNNDAYFSIEGGAQLDALSAYDHSGIGREFVSAVPTLTQKREHEERRSQLMVKGWKDTLSDSQSIPKSSLQKACNYETKCAQSQSMMTVAVYLVTACTAGLVIAWLVKNLAM